MVIPIMPKATVGERGPRRRTVRGRLAASRQLRGVAIIGALVLALIASVVVGRALSSDRTDASAPGQSRVIQQDPDADARRAGADTNRGAYTVSPPNERDAGAGVPTSPSYIYPAVYGDDEGVTPGDAVSPPLTGPRVQQGLYAAEVRDNGVDTTTGGAPYTFPAVYGDDEAR